MQPEERDAALLLDMLNAARDAVAFAGGRTYEEYLADRMLRSAIERQIEIIGEAARRISDTFQTAHPDIAWRGIITQRHVLAHEYGAIEHDRIWKVISHHIPELIRKLEPLIPPLPDTDTQE